MRVIKLLIFFSICVACFLSCATRSSASVEKIDMPYINLTDNSKFFLLPTEGIEHVMDMAQFLSAEIRGQNYFLNAWVIANENAIEMIFFNEMGASIGELSYKNGVADFASTVIPKSVKRYIEPEYIIADFQLCFYDPFLLTKSLKDSGFIFEITDSNGSRRILSGDEVIIEIKKTENTIELINHLRRYSYTLEGAFHE